MNFEENKLIPNLGIKHIRYSYYHFLNHLLEKKDSPWKSYPAESEPKIYFTAKENLIPEVHSISLFGNSLEESLSGTHYILGVSLREEPTNHLRSLGYKIQHTTPVMFNKEVLEKLEEIKEIFTKNKI